MLKDLLDEHKREYDDKALKDLFDHLKSEKSTRLEKMDEGKCLFGFVKFYFNYYAIMVIDYSKIGKIGDHIINRADKFKMVPMFTVDYKTSVFVELENKYLTIFKNFEISRQAYFSFSYNLTKTLQRNFVEKAKSELIYNYNDKNFWNNVLLDCKTNEILDKDFDDTNFFKNNFNNSSGNNINNSRFNGNSNNNDNNNNSQGNGNEAGNTSSNRPNSLVGENSALYSNKVISVNQNTLNSSGGNITFQNAASASNPENSLNTEIFNLNLNSILNTNNINPLTQNPISNLYSANNINNANNNNTNPQNTNYKLNANSLIVNNSGNNNNNNSSSNNNSNSSTKVYNNNTNSVGSSHNQNQNPYCDNVYVVRRNDLKKLTQNIFLWNNFHIKEFFNLMENKIWCVWFIYGFFEQVECLFYGQRFLVTVIGRRSRKFAGTRYLKRGINDEGDVANDVETEQILEEISTASSEKPIISSYVHIRGSVPIYWYQEQNGILPKPDIKVNLSDIFYESTTKHFMKLIERYGEPIIVGNLTKKHEDHKQETLLNECYENCVDYILHQLRKEEEST